MNIYSIEIKSLFSLEVFSLLMVLATFLIGMFVYRRFRLALLQPLLVSVLLIMVWLKFFGMNYQVFYAQTHLLNFMMGPAVVALGYVLFEQIEHVKGHIVAILISVFVGSVVAIVSVVLTARALGADAQLLASLAPKSVTLPIAVQLAKNAGGVPQLTIAFLLLSGLLGGLVGPMILRLLGIKSKLAIGLAIGSASHALGTARALELGAVEGAASGLAIGLMGMLTALVLPILERELY